jgi:DNA-binding transcriptional regulator YiaG
MNSYHYKECGLKHVYLENGFREFDTPFGNSVSIVDADGLHALIAKELVKSRPFLTGPEFRFVRKNLDLTQKRVGQISGYDAQTVARWEKLGRVPKWADHFLRRLYLEKATNKQFERMLARLSEIDRATDRLAFQRSGGGRARWRPSQEAA